MITFSAISDNTFGIITTIAFPCCHADVSACHNITLGVRLSDQTDDYDKPRLLVFKPRFPRCILQCTSNSATQYVLDILISRVYLSVQHFTKWPVISTKDIHQTFLFEMITNFRFTSSDKKSVLVYIKEM